MTTNQGLRFKALFLIPITLALLVIVACGSAAAPQTEAPAAAPQTEAPAAAPQPGAAAQTSQESMPQTSQESMPQPTAVPQQQALPAQAMTGKDELTIVMPSQPGSMDPWGISCTSVIYTAVCDTIVNEPMTWITSDTYEVVTLSGVESWNQVDARNWDFKLREGVKFHNGEPWNAETAKAGIDQNGNVDNGSAGFSYHGPISGEVVDEYTVRVVCGDECPVLARGMIFGRFQAPGWYATAGEEERNQNLYSFGPYKLVEWRPDIDIQMEIYEDYVPNPDSSIVDGQAPHVKNLTNIWRGEALVRAAMVQTGEADWAADVGFENKGAVPKWKQSSTSEVFALIPDAMWHPELKKKKVREALNLAIDCQTITDALLDGLPCWGNINPPGTVGVTDRNSKPYPFDPVRARELLAEANYDPENKIIIYSRTGNCCRNEEFQEAVIQYWVEVGVTAEFRLLEYNQSRVIQRAGCGQFAKEPDYVDVWDCAQRDPPGPSFASSHMLVTATSNEMLDGQVQANRRVGCLSTSTRACFPDIFEKVMEASATPVGDLRTQRMVEIFDFAYDEFIFIPFIEVQLVYGLAADLDWEPLYAPRVRANTMKFTQ